MPEIVGACQRFNTDAELDDALKLNGFEHISRDEIPPTVRRVCESSARNDHKLNREELVRELKEGSGFLTSRVVFGTIRRNVYDQSFLEYVGVDRKELSIFVADRMWVEKRRVRWEAFPLPTKYKDRRKHVQNLMVEIIQQWTGSDPKAKGVSVAQMVSHVADYCNIERNMAQQLVDGEIHHMSSIENAFGDHWSLR